MNRAELVEILNAAIPEIADALDDETWRGLCTLEVACFREYAQTQIDSGKSLELKRCYEIARKAFLNGDSEVKNAIGVSFVEDLNFSDGHKQRLWARTLLPQPLSDIRAELCDD